MGRIAVWLGHLLIVAAAGIAALFAVSARDDNDTLTVLAVGEGGAVVSYRAARSGATPTPPALASTLLVNDPTNLGIRLGIRLP